MLSAKRQIYPIGSMKGGVGMNIFGAGLDYIEQSFRTTAEIDAFNALYGGSNARSSAWGAFDFEGLFKAEGKNDVPVIYGARRVENLCLWSQDISNAAWDKDVTVTITGTNQAEYTARYADFRQDIATEAGRTYRVSADIQLVAGEANSDGLALMYTDSASASAYQFITSSYVNKRYSVEFLGKAGGGDVTIGLIYRKVDELPTVIASNWQVEDVTGQANQAPSAHIPTTTAAITKYYDTENGNTVASNIVTEAVGADLTNNIGMAVWPSVTNEFASGKYRTFSAWTTVICNVTKDQIGADGVANSASVLEDDSTSGFEQLYGVVPINNDSTWNSVSVLIKKDTDTTRYPYLIYRAMDGTTPLKEDIILNTQTGSVTELTSNGEYVVLEIGDWWFVNIALQNNSSGNITSRLELYPAGSVNGTSTTNTATGSVVVDWAQFCNARRCPVHLVPGGTTLAAQSNIAATAANAGELIAQDFGADVIGNGDFASSSIWDLGAGWTISGGQAIFSGSAYGPVLLQSTLTVDTTYRLTIDVAVGSVRVKVGTASYSVYSGIFIVTADITADLSIQPLASDVVLNSVVAEIVTNNKGAVYAEAMLMPDGCALTYPPILRLNGANLLGAHNGNARVNSSDGTNTLQKLIGFDGYTKVAVYWDTNLKYLTSLGDSTVIAPDYTYKGSWGTGNTDMYVGGKAGPSGNFNGIIGKIRYYKNKPKDETFWDAETTVT